MMDVKENGPNINVGLKEITRLHNCELIIGLSPADVGLLSDALAAMTPWKELGMEAANLHAYMLKEDPSLLKLTIRVADCLAGVLMVRHPWLRGPYVELFCVLPAYQGAGVGRSVIRHIVDLLSERHPNIWVCASEFNFAALKFYEREGFERVCVMADIVTPNYNEVLLRRRIAT